MIDKMELQREERFWDNVGEKWNEELDGDDLQVRTPAEFLSGSAVAFDDLLEQMGDIQGKQVLDYGCGSGWLSTFLAQKGAHVKGFDISSKLVQLGMKRASINGVADRVALHKMIAEKLDYPDGFFDLVVGISILHHISLEEGGKELHRVMKPGGRAFFIEPLGESRLLNWVRSRLFRVHHGHVRTVDAEHPLTYSDINSIGSLFSQTKFREFQLLEMIARVTGDGITRALRLDKIDRAIISTFPVFRKYCRLVVIRYIKSGI